MKTSLVIMAAGIGSRFGTGIKQLQTVGPNGEIIIDYSIHDAIQAGFNKIVFVIRKDIEEDFREVIGNRMERICKEKQVEVQYAFQSLDAIPNGYVVPAGRTKPWGTGQAILIAKELIHEPFAVINADDYYGKEAFVKVHDFLIKDVFDDSNTMCMAGFYLKNTLSEHGGVTRGICQVDDQLLLQRIDETPNIVKTSDGGMVGRRCIDGNSYVSMNMWGFTPKFLDCLEVGFLNFFHNIKADNEQKAEFLLPVFIDYLLSVHKVTVQVLETNDKWFGITYQEDLPSVMEAFRRLHEDGVYEKHLFSDVI